MAWIKDSTKEVALEVSTPIYTGSLDVSSEPSGATIYVNGDFIGVTPLLIQLNVGLYTVVLTKSGYNSVERSVSLQVDEVTYVSEELTQIPPQTAVLNVSSNPSGAEVYVDGNYEGTTFLSLNLTAGSYQVVVKLQRYKDYTVTKTLVAGQTSTISATLSPEVVQAGFGWLMGLGLAGAALKMYMDSKKRS
jgi:CRISPR/Cas system-associated exonuclease Cas4 (RecB family)